MMKTSDPGRLTPADYYCGLLCIWREGEDGAWRASLQPVESNERIGFADLERLFAHIRRLLAPPDDDAPSDDV